jgi:O-antigen/teichoic acid export membrane protein
MSFLFLAFRQSAVYMLFQVIGSGLSLITFPLLTRVLSVEDYGNLALVNATLAIVLAFAKSGISTSFIRLCPEYKSTSNESAVYSSSLFGAISTSGIVLIIYSVVVFFMRESLGNNLSKIFYITGLLIIPRNVLILVSSWFRAEGKVVILSSFNLIDRLGTVTLGLIFYVLYHNELVDFFKGVIFVEYIISLMILIYFFKNRLLKFRSVSFDVLKKLIFYGFPLIFYEISSLVNDYSDRFLIKYFLGSSDLGIYSVGYNLSIAIVGMITAPLWMSIFPIYTKLWDSEGEEKTRIFLSLILKYYICLAVFIITIFSICSKELIVIIASNKYAEAAHIVPLVISSVMINGTYHITGAGFFLLKKTKILAGLTMIAACFNFILNLFFIPKFGIIGAAYSTLFSYMLLAVLVTRSANKLLKLKWLSLLDLFFYLFLALIMFCVASLGKFDTNLYTLVFKSLSCITIYGTCIIFYDKMIKDKILMFMSSYRKK